MDDVRFVEDVVCDMAVSVVVLPQSKLCVSW